MDRQKVSVERDFMHLKYYWNIFDARELWDFILVVVGRRFNVQISSVSISFKLVLKLQFRIEYCS